LNKVRIFQWIVAPEESAIRLDTFLARHLSVASRRERTALIGGKYVLLNNKAAPKGTIVQTQDRITVFLPLASALPPPHPVTVEYHDDNIIIINKPSGIPSVALRHTDTQTVANFLKTHFPETEEVSSRPLEAGLVHRLDTETSGLLLAARTPLAYVSLREQFRLRTVGKYYLAIAEGRMTKDGQVSSPLIPTGPRGQRMRIVTDGRGQAAFTQYAILERLPHHTVVRLKIETGVRHQIRAHLAFLGHPIIGDKIYGSAEQSAERLCLHAETLTFRHPGTGQDFSHTSAPPEDFLAVLDQIRQESTANRERGKKKQKND
jgi:23S rRNA pseudouridine1911/1915/1917 synthase